MFTRSQPAAILAKNAPVSEKNYQMLRVFFALLFALSVLIGIGSPAYAEDGGAVEATTYIAKNDANIVAVVSEANSSVKADILSYDGKEGIVSFDFFTFNKLDSGDKEKFMESALSATNKSGLGAQRKSKLYAFISRQDGTVSAAVSRLRSDASADFYSGLSWLRPFSAPFSTFLGFVALVITSLGTMSVVFDLAAISIPFFQYAAQEKGIISRFVSVQARDALKQQENTGKSALNIWVRKRGWVLLFLGVAMLYLITGSIYDLMGWFLQVGGIH